MMNKTTQIVLWAVVMAVFGYTKAYAQRTQDCIDAEWKFSFGDASDPAKDFGCGTEYFNYLTKASSIHNTGPYSDKFDDSSWTSVNLPHDFVVDLPFAREASHSHGYKTVGYKYPKTSVGWYRKVFRVNESDRGKHFELQFDGIFRDSRVWVNGFYCGGERSGYLSQNYDITDYLNYSSENIICVRADATLEEGWFYEGGGIYRHVWLTKTSPVHIVNDGTTITTPTRGLKGLKGLKGSKGLKGLKGENDDTRIVKVKTLIQNGDYEDVRCKVRYTVLDKEGKEVMTYMHNGNDSHKSGTLVRPRASKTFSAVLPIKDPKLWSTDTPYLYKIKTEVIVDNETVDCKTETFGIRDVVFDKDRGLLLNGKEVKIKGVNMHQDHAGVGAGIPDGLLVYRIKKLKEMGCNAYRSSHNPMSPAMLDVCDSLGMLVIDENRLSGSSEYEISSLKKMIDRDKNHPCVILWSAGNEEWGIEWKEAGVCIAQTMKDYCHQFDPSREMTFATSGGPTVEIPVDVAGYNYIMQNPIDEYRKTYPERKCYGSEETTGCGTRGIYYKDAEGRWMPALNREKNGKDSIMNCIERGWQFYAERPWAAGCFYWTGFDYRGESNPLEYPATGSSFGILDYCGFPKDEAYYLKSWWTDETVLHLLPHWNLEGHEGEKVSVWAYSNCDEVELFVNGKSVGRKKMPRNGHLEWETTYKAGKLKAVGYKNGKKVKTETVETTGEACGIAAETFTHSDGISVVDICVKDKKGRVVPTACEELTLHVDGDARIIGVGNGDSSFKDVERPTADSDGKEFKVKTFNGYAQVIVQGRGANLRITSTHCSKIVGL